MSQEIPAPTDPATSSGALPDEADLWRAFVDRDPEWDGLFFVAVRTTGIFCRPTCPARRPLRGNVEFHATVGEALAAGFRPCRRCRPARPPGAVPDWLDGLIDALDDASGRLRDADLRDRGLDPARVRRWFNKHYGMTFHAYQRARRLGSALDQLALGDDIVATAYRNGFESLSGFNDAVRRLAGRSPGRARDARVVHVTRVPTPIGPMIAGATDDALCLLEFADRESLETKLERAADRLDAVVVPGETEAARKATDELERYFAGELTTFETPLDVPGTDFQQAVWSALREVPYGETISYGEQARRIGRPEAVRAVARANGDNRIAIIVPCHRVIGADGSLTGYGGGLWRKRRLLELERGEIALGL